MYEWVPNDLNHEHSRPRWVRNVSINKHCILIVGNFMARVNLEMKFDLDVDHKNKNSTRYEFLGSKLCKDAIALDSLLTICMVMIHLLHHSGHFRFWQITGVSQSCPL